LPSTASQNLSSVGAFETAPVLAENPVTHACPLHFPTGEQ
jgi:hypothetical protein